MNKITAEFVMEKLAANPPAGRLLRTGVATDTPQGRVIDTSSLQKMTPVKKSPVVERKYFHNPQSGVRTDVVLQDGKGTGITPYGVARNVENYAGTGDAFRAPSNASRNTYVPPPPATADDIKKAKTSVRNMFLVESPAPKTSMIDKIRSTTGNLSGRYVNTARPMFGGR